MPKIPTYRQQVGFEAGQLGPRLSGAAASQVGSAYANLGKAVTNVANIAAEFEKARQDQEANDLYNSLNAQATEELYKIIQDERYRDIPSMTQAFDTAAKGFIDSSITQSDKLSSRQKNSLRSSMTKRFNLLRVDGLKAANIRQGVDSQIAYDSGYEADQLTAINNPRMVEIYATKYEETSIEQAKLGIKTKDGNDFRVAAYKEIMFNKANNDSTSLNVLEDTYDAIMKGQGEYSTLNADERVLVASQLSSRISYLQDEVVGETLSNLEVITTSMGFAQTQTDRENFFAQGEAEIAKLASLGQTAEAEKARIGFNAYKNGLDAGDNLAFATNAEITRTINDSLQSVKDAAGTEAILSKQKEHEALVEVASQIAQKRQEDPVDFIQKHFQRVHNKQPTVEQIVQKQRQFGIPEGEIKILSTSQANSVVESVNEAMLSGDGLQVAEVFRGIPGLTNHSAKIMSQLSASGLSTAAQFVASQPNSPINKTLMKATAPGAITINVTKNNKTMARQTVANDPTMQNFMNSVGGQMYRDFENNEILSSGADTTQLKNFRNSMLDMVTDVALYLMQEDRKFFDEESVADSGEFSAYAEQAVAIIKDRYSFSNVNDSVLRLPKSYEQAAPLITEGIDIEVFMLNKDRIFYASNSGFDVGSPEFEKERELYLERVRSNYGVMTKNGDKDAIIVDEFGGAVLINTRDDEGNPAVEPLTVNFNRAVQLNNEYGAPALDRLREERARILGLKKAIGAPPYTEAEQDYRRQFQEQADAITEAENRLRRRIAERSKGR